MLAAVLRALAPGQRCPSGSTATRRGPGIDARRCCDEGWIGPYVESALGQPTGPLYFTALLFKFFPQTTFTLRLSMALFGIATIPVAYLAFASMFNRTVGAFAALLLTVMMWHLHLSRTAFMVTAWPFIEMAVLWVAVARDAAPAAGGCSRSPARSWGLGVYSYNAYLLFLPIPLVAIAVSLVHARRAPRFGRCCGERACSSERRVVGAPCRCSFTSPGTRRRIASTSRS